MSNLLKAILENEILKDEVKTLLVKHGMYKEARELMESQKVINIDPKFVIKTRPTMIQQNGGEVIHGGIIAGVVRVEQDALKDVREIEIEGLLESIKAMQDK